MKIKQILLKQTPNSIAFFNMLGPIALNGINFFTLPLFTRILTQDDFGIVSVYTTWVAVVSVFAGLQTQGSIGTAFAFFPEKMRKQYMSSILAISLLSFVLIMLITIIFRSPLSAFTELKQQIVFIMVLQAFGAFGVNFASTKFTFSKEAHKTFLVSLIVSLSSAILSVALIFVYNGNKGYEARILGMALPNILTGLFFAGAFLIQGKTFYSREYWRFCLPIALPLIFHGLSHLLLSQSARIVIQKHYGFAQVGIYNLIFTFVQVLSILYTALNNTWVPFYYDDLKKRDYAAINQKTKNYMLLFTSLTVGFLLVSPEVLRIFAAKNYWGGTPLIPSMAVSVYFTFLYSFPVNFQFFHRKTIWIAVGTMLAAGMNIVLANAFTPVWGLQGAAAAMLISYFFLFVFHHILATFVIKAEYHYGWLTAVKGLVPVGCACLLFFFCAGLWPVRWGAAILVGIFLITRILKNKRLF